MLASRRVGVAQPQRQQQRHRQCRSQELCLSSRPAACSALSARQALTGLEVGWRGSSAAELQMQMPRAAHTAAGTSGRKAVTMMGNKATGGPFSPLVTVVRNIMGEKEFNKLRGKAISLHSQVIKEFCKQFGVENKQVQGVIRLAKKNGEWLGFLA